MREMDERINFTAWQEYASRNVRISSRPRKNRRGTSRSEKRKILFENFQVSVERETVRVVESLHSVPGKRPRNSKYSTEARSKRKLVSSSAIREKKKKKNRKIEIFRIVSLLSFPLSPSPVDVDLAIDPSCGVERLINSVQGRIDERHALVVSSFYIRAIART